jgi:hypothetical protein
MQMQAPLRNEFNKGEMNSAKNALLVYPASKSCLCIGVSVRESSDPTARDFGKITMISIVSGGWL